MCALVVWIHHSQIKISEPRHRLQQCWQGSAARTHTHMHAHVHTHTETPKRRRSPGARRKNRPIAPAQLSLLGSTTLSKMENDVPTLGHSWDNLGLTDVGVPHVPSPPDSSSAHRSHS